MDLVLPQQIIEEQKLRILEKLGIDIQLDVLGGPPSSRPAVVESWKNCPKNPQYIPADKLLERTEPVLWFPDAPLKKWEYDITLPLFKKNFALGYKLLLAHEISHFIEDVRGRDGGPHTLSWGETYIEVLELDIWEKDVVEIGRVDCKSL